jgi:hypothetical protein
LAAVPVAAKMRFAIGRAAGRGAEQRAATAAGARSLVAVAARVAAALPASRSSVATAVLTASPVRCLAAVVVAVRPVRAAKFGFGFDEVSHG